MEMTFKQFIYSIFGNSKYGDPNSEFKLPDETMSTIMSHIVEKSLWSRICRDGEISEVNAASVTYLKNIGGELKDKEGIGAGNPDKMTFVPVTIRWWKPKKIYQAFTQADHLMGFPDASAVKLIKFIDQYAKAFERTAWRSVGESEITKQKSFHEFDFEQNEAKKIWQEIISAGTNMTLKEDPSNGLDLISEDQIEIHAKPTIMDKLASAGLVGDRTYITFQGGQYSIAKVGGYTIVANPFLKEYEVIIATTFTGGDGKKLVAANIERIRPSNDQGVYFEALGAAGIVYETTIHGIKQKTKEKEQKSSNLTDVDVNLKELVTKLSGLENELNETKNQLDETEKELKDLKTLKNDQINDKNEEKIIKSEQNNQKNDLNLVNINQNDDFINEEILKELEKDHENDELET